MALYGSPSLDSSTLPLSVQLPGRPVGDVTSQIALRWVEKVETE